MKNRRYDELLAAVYESQEKLIHFRQCIPAEEFNKDRGIRFRGYKVTIARLLQAEMDDAKVHLRQVETLSQQQPASATIWGERAISARVAKGFNK